MTSQNGRAGEADPSDYLSQLVTLLPGDSVEMWEAGNLVVKTVFICREVVDDEPATWNWLFLDDGSLLETSPDGYFWYRRHQVQNQGTSVYEELVAQDGALVRFEERVRAGSSGRRPVHVTLYGKEYRISSTGTVSVQRLGEQPKLSPWQSFSSNPDDNVYFGLVETADESSVGLGLWTQHVCLSFGRELADTDVTGVYKQSGKR